MQLLVINAIPALLAIQPLKNGKPCMISYSQHLMQFLLGPINAMIIQGLYFTVLLLEDIECLLW